ncbi:MAG: hypothetical protein FWG20_00730 [Candidatus Cloacimonetes bacterium]|nr:hypothetical protein [Candidatus Cloacimonadota bacterium]
MKKLMLIILLSFVAILYSVEYEKISAFDLTKEFDLDCEKATMNRIKPNGEGDYIEVTGQIGHLEINSSTALIHLLGFYEKLENPDTMLYHIVVGYYSRDDPENDEFNNLSKGQEYTLKGVINEYSGLKNTLRVHIIDPTNKIHLPIDRSY